VLLKKMDAQKDPSQTDIARFLKLAVSTPAVWPWATVMMPSIRRTLIEKISQGSSRVSMLAELDSTVALPVYLARQ